MKKVIVVCMTLSLGYQSLTAQTEPTEKPKGFLPTQPKAKKNVTIGLSSKMSPEQRATVMTQTLAKRLNLTEEQIEKVIPINEELAQKLDELASYREDKAYFNQKFDDAHQQAESQYSSIFTAEQLTTFKVMQERNRERRQQVRE